jgi:transposase
VEGRRRLCVRVDAGRKIAHVAAEAGVARQTLGKWYGRWQAAGLAGLADRCSGPHGCPTQTPVGVEDGIETLRRRQKLGPVMIAGRLAAEGVTIAASTVHRVLVRRGISRLAGLDVTGMQLRAAAKASRYEHAAAGELVHVDVKKLGRIPDGGSWRAHGARLGATQGRPRPAGRLRLPAFGPRRLLPAGLHRRTPRREGNHRGGVFRPGQ